MRRTHGDVPCMLDAQAVRPGEAGLHMADADPVARQGDARLVAFTLGQCHIQGAAVA